MEFPVLHPPRSVDVNNYLAGLGTKTEFIETSNQWKEENTCLNIVPNFFLMKFK